MITVVGTGSWGTTLAVLIARGGTPTVLLTRSAPEAAALSEARENRRYLSGVRFPDNLKVLHRPEEALAGAALVLLVVPSQTMRENARRLRPHLPADTVVASAAKGLEIDTGQRMSEVIVEVLGTEWSGRVAAISGPNLSAEVAAGLPTATVVAAHDETVAAFVQSWLRVPHLRAYTNPDLVGVELGGALKNIIAIAAGACDGFGYGDNAKAAIITRGLAEIARLGVALGAVPLTFAGLAGIGDLFATCSSRFSRNRYVGEELAKGRSLADIQTGMAMVAEGVGTTAAACRLAARHGVEMPITATIHRVLFAGLPPKQAVAELMARDRKEEMADITHPPDRRWR